MQSRAATKVGGVVLIALLVFAGLFIYLAHINPNTYTVRVRFSDTKGLDEQGSVRMQGVTIGEVKEVVLDTTHRPLMPMLVLAIEKKFSIPRGSKFTIESGVLITNPILEIVPGDGPPISQAGSVVVDGEAATGMLAQFSPEVDKTVKNVNRSFDDLTVKMNAAYKKIDRILDQTNVLLTTANRTMQTGHDLIADPRLKSSLIASVENLKQVTVDAKSTSGRISRDLHDLVASGKGKFDKLSDNLLDLLTKVGNTVDEANSVVAKLTEQVTDPRLQESLQETAELARATIARFNQIASDLHQLTGDPQLQNDLKVAVDKLRVTTENGQQVVEKVNTLLGNVVGPGGKFSRPRLPSVHFIGNASESLDPTRLRVDAIARISAGQRNFFDLGFYDLGQDTRLTLQGGSRISDSADFRYGLYASKLAVGIDYQPADVIGFRADLWDTSSPRLDAKALFKVDSTASLWIGADNIFRRPIPIVGVQFSK